MAMMAFAGTDEVEGIADQLRRMYEGPAWHGPALQQLLSDVTAERAAARPLPHAHTIWELVLHIAAWMRIARERITATAARDATDEENWPPIASKSRTTGSETPCALGPGSWTDALSLLDTEYRNLEAAIRVFSRERLNDAAPAAEPQTFYILFHGVIQHIAYHAGQIAILKK